MSDRHLVATEEELGENGSKVLTEIEGIEIAVYRIDDEFYAISNFCIHASGPLCENGITGDHHVDPQTFEWEYSDSEHVCVCPWHGWMFDIKTGKSVSSDRYAVPTFEVEVSGGEIFVTV